MILAQLWKILRGGQLKTKRSNWQSKDRWKLTEKDLPNIAEKKYFFIQNISNNKALAIKNDELIEEEFDEYRLKLEQLWEFDLTKYDKHFKLRNNKTGKMLSASEDDKLDIEGMF